MDFLLGGVKAGYVFVEQEIPFALFKEVFSFGSVSMEVCWELSHGSYIWGVWYWLEGLRWNWWLCSATSSSTASSATSSSTASSTASSSTASSDRASEGSIKSIVNLLSCQWRGCWSRLWLCRWRLDGSEGLGGCRGHGWCGIGWRYVCSNSRWCAGGEYPCPAEGTISYLEV